MKNFILLALVLTSCSLHHLKAQRKLKLVIQPVDQPDGFFKKSFGVKSEVGDSLEAVKELNHMVRNLQKKGYLGASVDSLHRRGDSMVALVYCGMVFEWLSLTNGNVSEDLLKEIGYKEKLFPGSRVNLSEANQLFDRLLKHCENTGYPFARVQLDSFRAINNGIAAKIYLNKFDLIMLDTVKVHGDAKINYRFLLAYLGIKKNGPYNESDFRKISSRINELPYIAQTKEPVVDFINDKATVHLNLENKKASQFNFLLGFLPKSASTGSLMITGEAKLRLLNPFGNGMEIYLDWQKLQPRTQNLDIGFRYPYIFNFPLGLDVGLRIDKIDTLFITIDADYGLQYLTIGDNYLKVFGKSTISNILSVDTALLMSTRQLPSQLDYSVNSVGLEYKQEHLDYRFNPRSGYLLKSFFTAGARKVKVNSTIASITDPVTEESFEYLYDSIRLNMAILELGLNFDYYLAVRKRSTIKFSVSNKFRLGKEILTNEKYRIGGVNLLRGFDEESIYTPYYTVLSTEYRFLLARNSFFYVFFDAGLVEDIRTGAGNVDWPFGFGAGLALRTKAGIFGLTYALGKQLDNKIDFRAAKIHLGYISLF